MYNYNFLNDQWYRNMNYNSYRNTSMPSLFTPVEGYNNGNLFSDLYSQYKNYQPVTLTARNDKERILLELSRMAFAAHELNLYLDLHPEDTTMLTLFNDYRQKTNDLTKQYEEKYGPLSISSDALTQAPFMWEQNAWPWEVQRNV